MNWGVARGICPTLLCGSLVPECQCLDHGISTKHTSSMKSMNRPVEDARQSIASKIRGLRHDKDPVDLAPLRVHPFKPTAILPWGGIF